MEIGSLEGLAKNLAGGFGIELKGEDGKLCGESETLDLRVSYSKNGNSNIFIGENIHVVKKHPFADDEEAVIIMKQDDGFSFSYLTFDINLATLRFSNINKRYEDLLLLVLRRRSQNAKQYKLKHPNQNYSPGVIGSRVYDNLDEARDFIEFMVDEFNKPPFSNIGSN